MFWLYTTTFLEDIEMVETLSHLVLTFCLKSIVREQKKVLFSPLHIMKWEWWNSNVPAWHGACVAPHISLVTAGYQHHTSQPLVVSALRVCASFVCSAFLSYLMREVSVCVRVGSARRIIITSPLIAVITTKCQRDWEWSCIGGWVGGCEKVRMYLQDEYHRAR